MTEIIKNVWLCSWEEAKKIIPTLEYPLVINCSKNLDFIAKNTIRIPIDDSPDYNNILQKIICDVCKSINYHHIQGYPVVIHCLAGRQRSVAVSICFLMLYYNMEDPISYLRNLRKDNFIILEFLNFKETIEFIKKKISYENFLKTKVILNNF